MTEKVYIESNRVVKESKCKYYKRIIVGLIRYMKDENISLSVPEEYFDDVSDNTGFTDETDNIPNRTFEISDNWEIDGDDCGGESFNLNNTEFFIGDDGSVCFQENKKMHLKIV